MIFIFLNVVDMNPEINRIISELNDLLWYGILNEDRVFGRELAISFRKQTFVSFFLIFYDSAFDTFIMWFWFGFLVVSYDTSILLFRKCSLTLIFENQSSGL
uniref:Uncharacterized protein n=1 Tax=Rhizophagus irregularis (strain DAOM 181602 / DAOM 197198 / MUCL 43194) TaxID=747089 RepID=U9UU75_RHIID